jgi:hypothetical protein
MSAPPSPHITLAMKALNEGYRIVAAAFNDDVLAKRAPGVWIESERKRKKDNFQHARKAFRQALPDLRAASVRARRPLPPDDDAVVPWTFGFVNGKNGKKDRPVPVGLDGGWADRLPEVVKFLQERDWSPQQFRAYIADPVQRHHEAWLQRLRTLAGPPEDGGSRTKRPTVNDRMAAMFHADLTRVQWSAARWADELSAALERSVSAAAVKQTATWKGPIRKARAIMKAERQKETERVKEAVKEAERTTRGR